MAEYSDNEKAVESGGEDEAAQEENTELKSSDSKDSSTPSTSSPVKSKRGAWGAAARLAARAPTKGEPNDPAKKTLKSVAKRVNRQIKAMSLIKRWTQMTSLGQFAKDEEHLNFIREATKRTTMDIPAPIEHCMWEETITILQARY